MALSKKWVVGIIGSMFLLSSVGAYAFNGHELSGAAKFSMDQARAIALKTYPGKIVDQELEKEKGGSGLRYSFVIKRGRVSHEVGVDARTGAVLENAIEGTHAD